MMNVIFGTRHGRVPPVHRLDEAGTYIVTASTHGNAAPFCRWNSAAHASSRGTENRGGTRCPSRGMGDFSQSLPFRWRCNGCGGSLRDLVREIHSRTAIALNRHDATPGRKVWHNFWDTRLTHERSYFARLNYVHQNPVKHGLVTAAPIIRIARPTGSNGPLYPHRFRRFTHSRPIG